MHAAGSHAVLCTEAETGPARLHDRRLFQLPVLILELLQMPQFADTETAVHLLLAVKHLLRNPHSLDDLGHRCASFRLLQCEGNLLVRVPRFLNFQFLARKASQGRKTLAQHGLKKRGDINCSDKRNHLFYSHKTSYPAAGLMGRRSAR